jgi:hypothetical protein
MIIRKLLLIFSRRLSFFKAHSVYEYFGSVTFVIKCQRLVKSFGPTCKLLILWSHDLLSTNKTMDEATRDFIIKETPATLN